MSTRFEYLILRARVRHFIHETWEKADEFEFATGPTQDDVAHEFFEGDHRQALSVLKDLERLGEARRVITFDLHGWIPATPEPGSSASAQKNYARTELTERVLKYVTAEFNEGRAGNRRTLPSTYDVAKACTIGGGKAKACRRALRHLNYLLGSDDIIQVKDDDVNARRNWQETFWAISAPDTRLKPTTPSTDQAVTFTPQKEMTIGSRIDHRDCPHPATKAARKACRREWLYMDVSAL